MDKTRRFEGVDNTCGRELGSSRLACVELCQRGEHGGDILWEGRSVGKRRVHTTMVGCVAGGGVVSYSFVDELDVFYPARALCREQERAGASGGARSDGSAATCAVCGIHT